MVTIFTLALVPGIRSYDTNPLNVANGETVKIFHRRARQQANDLTKQYAIGTQTPIGTVEEVSCTKSEWRSGWIIKVKIKLNKPITTKQYLTYLFTGKPLPE